MRAFAFIHVTRFIELLPDIEAIAANKIETNPHRAYILLCVSMCVCWGGALREK